MNQYQDGTYLSKNPTWDVEDSPWKAENVIKILQRNQLSPTSIAEVGCGAGEILRQLYECFPESCELYGYDISPQAIEICRQREADRLQFYLQDILEAETIATLDLIMALDVIEHIEDYIGFLRKLRDKAEYKVFHIPLDMSVNSVLRMKPILHARDKVGHLHYFSKETVLATMKDTGYEVIDYFYTSGPLNRTPRAIEHKFRLADIIKGHIFTNFPNSWVRLFGGSMMLLAK